MQSQYSINPVIIVMLCCLRLKQHVNVRCLISTVCLHCISKKLSQRSSGTIPMKERLAKKVLNWARLTVWSPLTSDGVLAQSCVDLSAKTCEEKCVHGFGWALILSTTHSALSKRVEPFQHIFIVFPHLMFDL